MAPHSSALAWKIPWTEEPGRLQSLGSRRVGHDWVTSLFTFFIFEKSLKSSMKKWSQLKTERRHRNMTGRRVRRGTVRTHSPGPMTPRQEGLTVAGALPRSSGPKPLIRLPSLGDLHWEGDPPEVWLWRLSGLVGGRVGGLQETAPSLLKGHTKPHVLRVQAETVVWKEPESGQPGEPPGETEGTWDSPGDGDPGGSHAGGLL